MFQTDSNFKIACLVWSVAVYSLSICGATSLVLECQFYRRVIVMILSRKGFHAYNRIYVSHVVSSHD